MLNLSAKEFFIHTSAVRSAATDGPLMIACDPFQSQVQGKLDQLFGSKESESNVVPMKRPSPTKKKPVSRRRHLSANSAAGRRRRMEFEDTLQMRVKRKSMLRVGQALKAIVSIFSNPGS
jgi:hypothetical protein